MNSAKEPYIYIEHKRILKTSIMDLGISTNNITEMIMFGIDAHGEPVFFIKSKEENYLLLLGVISLDWFSKLGNDKGITTKEQIKTGASRFRWAIQKVKNIYYNNKDMELELNKYEKMIEDVYSFLHLENRLHLN